MKILSNKAKCQDESNQALLERAAPEIVRFVHDTVAAESRDGEPDTAPSQQAAPASQQKSC